MARAGQGGAAGVLWAHAGALTQPGGNREKRNITASAPQASCGSPNRYGWPTVVPAGPAPARAGMASSLPRGAPPTSLEGTAQSRLAVPLVVTDGPIATSGGLFGTVTPGTQLVSTALTVSGAELQRWEETGVWLTGLGAWPGSPLWAGHCSPGVGVGGSGKLKRAEMSVLFCRWEGQKLENATGQGLISLLITLKILQRMVGYLWVSPHH